MFVFYVFLILEKIIMLMDHFKLWEEYYFIRETCKQYKSKKPKIKWYPVRPHLKPYNILG